MAMPAGLRKLLLTLHVASSVGWLGAVGGFLALALQGLTSQDVDLTRGVYLSMDITTWFVIVPLAFASLITGIASSISSPWGLIRHYWVLLKLLTTAFVTVILMVHMRPIESLASAAARGRLDAALHEARQLMVIASGLAIVALSMLTGISVYKPRGMTPFSSLTTRRAS
jgi:hypothetical protein